MRGVSSHSAFLIFDNASFSLSLFKNNYRKANLFPLTANWKDIGGVSSGLRELNIEINILDSAKIISEQAALYRERFIDWAGLISNFNIGSRPLREWMLLPDGWVSAWWFGLLSDKDATKSQVFLKIARTGAILEQVKNCGSSKVILALKDRVYLRQLRFILAGQGIDCRIVHTKISGKEFLRALSSFFKKINTIRMLYTVVAALLMKIYIKLKIPPLKARKTVFSDALLFFTYFPSLLKPEVRQDRFNNKFAGPLQDLCRAHKKDIVWVVSYGEFDGISFRSAVEMARRFVKNQEFLFFWLEFLSFKNILSALMQYFRLFSAHKYLKNKLGYSLINRITGCGFSGLFFIEAMNESFYGGYYLNGIIQYEAFKNMFKKLSGFSQAVYTCEMMGWEYAFNAAQRREGKTFPVIGYQDFSFSNDFLQMFHSKEELKFRNTAGGIPLPEVIASCGRIPQAMLEKYYGNIANLETLRFAYLGKFMQWSDKPIKKTKGNRFILLVCTNIDMKESRGMVNLIDTVHENIKNEVEVWFKEHPALPIQKVFRESGITFNNHPYIFKTGPVADSLIQCDAVLTGRGSIAIEALAFGCEVLVYLNPEMLNTSSLSGFEEFYWKVYDPGTLSEAIENIRIGRKREIVEKKHHLVGEYWNLNHSMDGWKRVLNLK